MGLVMTQRGLNGPRQTDSVMLLSNLVPYNPLWEAESADSRLGAQSRGPPPQEPCRAEGQAAAALDFGVSSELGSDTTDLGSNPCPSTSTM